MLKVLDTTTETEETPATPTLDDLARRCCMKDLLRVGRFGPHFSSPQKSHCRDAVEGSSHV